MKPENSFFLEETLAIFGYFLHSIMRSEDRISGINTKIDEKESKYGIKQQIEQKWSLGGLKIASDD